MRAYVTSIGEPTEELCIWSLERNGFDVRLVKDPASSLRDKLHWIYYNADESFLRVDADIIVNKWFVPQALEWLDLQDPNIWWWQFKTFDWLKLDINHSMAYIKKEALPDLRNGINSIPITTRPETEMSRIKEFYNPRRFDTYEAAIVGLHGYKTNLEEAKQLKHRRNQQDLYDFEMAERLNSL